MSPLLKELRGRLAELADPGRAPQMQAYMKSTLPYHGVAMPIARKLFQELFRERAPATAEIWQRDVLHIWRGAKFREERYGAIALTRIKAAKPFQTLEAMAMYEELIVSGAWWDFVDELAQHNVGTILHNDPKPMTKLMRAWSRDDNLWKRRSAILCQLRAKEKTDLDPLYDCIEPSVQSKEFFLRKAIGWALRQHASVDAAEIKRYIKKNSARLHALSLREAQKHL